MITKNKKVSFFFGAGAEIDFGINSGYDFMLNTIYRVKRKSKKFLKEYTDNKDYLGENNKISNSLINDFIQCLNDNKSFNLNDNEIIELRSQLQNLNLSNLVNAISNIRDEKKGRSKIYKFFDMLCKDNSHRKKSLVDAFECIKLSNKLDGYFYNLLDYERYNKKDYNKVFNYYWFCFMDIIESLRKIDILDNSEFNDLYEMIKYSRDLNNINKIKQRINFDNSYYKIIKEQFSNKDGIKINSVVTTNYTYLSSYILDGKNTYNIHGSLDCFECSDRLMFKSKLTRKDCEEHLFFPFLMGLSNIKPIISYEQIKIFYKGFNKIYNSNYLVVIGYRLNENDSHINEMLKCYIRKRKKIIFISDMNKENIKQSLKLKGEYNNIICLNYEKENIKENLIKNVLEEIEKDKLIRI